MLLAQSRYEAYLFSLNTVKKLSRKILNDNFLFLKQIRKQSYKNTG